MTPGSSRSGVTLIELMLAFAILCISTLSVTNIMGFGLKGTAKEFMRIEALQLLTDRLNRLSALPFKRARVFPPVDSGIIANTVEGMDFGMVTIGKNTYEVTAQLTFQPITFPDIMALKLPNPGYDKDRVNTWQFENKAVPAISDQVIKVVVSVRPAEKGNQVAYQAMTFITDME